MCTQTEFRPLYRPQYEKLKALLPTQGRNLNTSCHSFRAVFNGHQIGLFSTLAMAFQEVDQRTKISRGAKWKETFEAHSGSYVKDLVSGRIYERAVLSKGPDCGLEAGSDVL